MVQELANYDNFASMFQTSRPNMNAYSGGGMHLPAFYGGSQVQPGQYTHDYGQYGDGIGSNIPPQSGTPSPTSWSAAAASMYHQQTAATAGSRHTPPTLEDWSQNSPFTGHNSALSVAVSQNGASTYSYRPSAMHAAQFSNMPQDLGHYVQSTPNSMIPPSSQSPSPNSGSSHHGGGVGSSPISRQSRGPYEWMKRQPFQGGPPTGICKTRTKDKYRIVYSEYQKVELEKEYLYSKYITIQRKAELARSIGLSERQVKIWFQNRRAKERKQKRKREDAIASVHSPGDDDHTKDIEPIKVEPSQDYIPTVNPQGHMHHHHLSSPV